MNDERKSTSDGLRSVRDGPINVAIVAFPETSASVVYGLFDLLSSAGRDWGFIVDGSPGTPLMQPVVVAVKAEALLRGRRATVATACSGAILLAEGGLLDGLEATTHWAWCDALRRRHPTVRVHERRPLVITGEGQRLVMAGGGTSWLDLALYLFGRFTDVEVAMRVARINLIDWPAIGRRSRGSPARARSRMR